MHYILISRYNWFEDLEVALFRLECPVTRRKSQTVFTTRIPFHTGCVTAAVLPCIVDNARISAHSPLWRLETSFAFIYVLVRHQSRLKDPRSWCSCLNGQIKTHWDDAASPTLNAVSLVERSGELGRHLCARLSQRGQRRNRNVWWAVQSCCCV